MQNGAMQVSFGKAADLLERLRNSYWVVPTLMLLAAGALAYGMVQLDFLLQASGKLPKIWFLTIEASGGRSVLSDLATSMATIAGVVFSITIVALQLASSQFGPHVLRSFLADRGNQISLGTFVSTFLYALLITLSIREKSNFVPYASTYTAMVIGVAAMGVLIYFIDHVANFIRLEGITATLALDLRQATHSVFPDALGEGEQVERETEPQRSEFAARSQPICVNQAGYVRRLDDAMLMRLACRHGLTIWLSVRPGDFVLPGKIVMEVAPAESLDEKITDSLVGTLVLGIRRTPNQDIPYALQQLAEVAIRALSPGINAPFTAIPCIDLLGEGLCVLAERKMPSLRRLDEKGRVRVFVARGTTLAGLTSVALGPIASAGRSHAEIMARLIETALLVSERVQNEEDRKEIRSLAECFRREALAGLRSDRERHIAAAAGLC